MDKIDDDSRKTIRENWGHVTIDRLRQVTGLTYPQICFLAGEMGLEMPRHMGGRSKQLAGAVHEGGHIYLYKAVTDGLKLKIGGLRVEVMDDEKRIIRLVQE